MIQNVYRYDREWKGLVISEGKFTYFNIKEVMQKQAELGYSQQLSKAVLNILRIICRWYHYCINVH